MDKDVKRIVLGSGENYLKEVTGTVDASDVDQLITDLFTADNRWGDTKNGATLTYTPTSYTVTDDLGRIMETTLTKEEVKLTFGVVAINSKILLPLMETARVETSTVDGRVIVKIGGIVNATGKSYLVGFKHLDAKRGNIYVIIVGKNDGELQFSFNPESETVLNPSFTAGALDEDGTKIIIVMDQPGVGAAAAVANKPSGTTTDTE